MNMSYELGRTWKEVTTMCFRTTFQQLFGMNEEDYERLSENRSPYNDSNCELINHEAEVITTAS
jgi:hypothetical protein